MLFTGFINKKVLNLIRKISRKRFLGLIVFLGVYFLSIDAFALSPIKRIASEDFSCVMKGFLPNKICKKEKEPVKDDFLDNEGIFGINVKNNNGNNKGIEEEVDVIFDEAMSDEEAQRVDSLLKELQAEADIFLVEDFRKGQRISLEESIYLALRDNEGVGFGNASALESNISKGITSAYLDRTRVIQELLAFEETWTPQWDTTLNAQWTRQYNREGPYTETINIPVPSVNTSQKLKSGGTINMSWLNTYTITRISGQESKSVATTVLNFNYTQPLLRGGGFEIGTIPLTKAYLADEASINNLKQVVLDNVTLTIRLYRAYLRAIDEFEIDKRAIYKGRDDLANTKILVEAGRRAQSDIVERQRYLAQQEFNFQDQRNTVDRARIDFLRQLNMDTGTNLVPHDLYVLDIEPEDMPKIEELLAIAFINNPTYLNELISFRNAELDYMKARNDVLWDLTFNTGISTSVTRASLGRSNENAWDFRDRAVTAGLTLVIPFNKLEARKSALLNAKINLRNAKINLRKREQDLTAQIKDRLRSIKKDIIQIKIAKINTLLSKKRVYQKRLEIEGGQSSSFELTGVQDDLISAEKAELDAKVNFMDDLADLDNLLGTTLDTWNININRRTENMPELSKTIFGKIKT
ncbi:MAG: hypothetical protein C5B43_05125 [Verrucomicrobia bacterium]|nr:MAG: hypothetical protein C5B43_05125 [Verrucomicrobiota bacterium]